MFAYLSRRSRVLSFLLASSFLMGYGNAALAVTVSPVIYDETLDPGKTVQGLIHVLNDTTEDQTYYTSVQNFVAVGEEGQQTFLPETDSTTGLASWISLEEASVKLKPGDRHDFKWALAIPKNAEPGGHYAAVFFSTTPKNEQESGVGVGGKTGVLMLINVTGNIKESAKAESLTVMSHGDPSSVQPTSFLNRLPASLELRVKNEGSVHIKPQGVVVITNMFGNRVAGVNVNPNDSRVLPSSIRKIRTSWGPGIEEPVTGVFANIAAEWNGFALGRYTATVEATYGKQHLPLTSSATFWVFPWRLALLAFLAFLVIIFLIKGYNRMVVKAAMSKVSQK